MTDPDAPTGADDPLVDPVRAVDPKTAELRAEKNPPKRLGKVLAGRPSSSAA